MRSWKHKWKSNFCWILPPYLFYLNKENVRSISVRLVRINWIAPDGEVLLVVVDKAIRTTNRPTFYWHGEFFKLVNLNKDEHWVLIWLQINYLVSDVFRSELGCWIETNPIIIITKLIDTQTPDLVQNVFVFFNSFIPLYSPRFVINLEHWNVGWWNWNFSRSHIVVNWVAGCSYAFFTFR